MLHVESRLDGQVLTLRLEGVFDELTHLDEHVGKGATEIRVYCRDVSRINSIGISIWRKVFHELRCNGVRLKFFEISPSLVVQLNYVVGFIEQPEIESLCLPFSCAACDKETLKSFTVAELESFRSSPLAVPCAHCGAEAEFDDMIDEYCAFLKS